MDNTEIDARITALVNQRNEALNQVVFLQGILAITQKQFNELKNKQEEVKKEE